MRKVLYNLLIIALVIFPINVFAEGYISVSSSSLTITEGSSKTITITAYNAIGDVTIKSNDTTIATVDTKSWATGVIGDHQTKKGTITVKGLTVGKTTLTFNIDGSTFDSESLRGQVKTVTVNVVEKKVDTRSKNNKLKTLEIEGYNLNKVDNNNYTLTVSNDVTSINVFANAEDSKAKVSGIGIYDLKVGENNITVVVTAENGVKNSIKIKVTRKDGYYLTDLEKLLNDNKLNELDIIIDNDSKISVDYLEKIKKSNKTVKFNYFDKNKKMLYSWIIDGGKNENNIDIMTMISYESDNKEDISKLSNYAEGMYVNFKHKGNLPEGTKVKIYVGDKYENGNVVNIYHYLDNALKMEREGIKVDNGYIEFPIEHCSEYFVTRAVIKKDTITVNEENKMNLFVIVSLLELFIIFILLILLIKKKKNSVKKNNHLDDMNNANLFENEDNVFLPFENVNTNVGQQENVVGYDRVNNNSFFESNENVMQPVMDDSHMNASQTMPVVNSSEIEYNNQNNNFQ